jgi:hypothetical protein
LDFGNFLHPQTRREGVPALPGRLFFFRRIVRELREKKSREGEFSAFYFSAEAFLAESFFDGGFLAEEFSGCEADYLLGKGGSNE